MLIRTLTTGLVLALAACSSKQPVHKWVMQNDEGGAVPSRRMAEAPRIIVEDVPISLLSFAPNADPDYEERKLAAQKRATADTAANWTSGIAQGVLESPRCGLLMPICAGVFVVGGVVTLPVAVVTSGAVTGVRHGTSEVTDQQADRLAAAVSTAGLNEKFSAWAETRIGNAPRPGDYPRLALRVTAVEMMPTYTGVAFRVAVAAQALPAPGEEWQASQHYIQLPARTAGEWLGSDGEGKQLRHDLNSALKVLAFRIVPLYLPPKEREARPRTVQPWEKR